MLRSVESMFFSLDATFSLPFSVFFQQVKRNYFKAFVQFEIMYNTEIRTKSGTHQTTKNCTASMHSSFDFFNIWNHSIVQSFTTIVQIGGKWRVNLHCTVFIIRKISFGPNLSLHPINVRTAAECPLCADQTAASGYELRNRRYGGKSTEAKCCFYSLYLLFIFTCRNTIAFVVL